MAVYTDAASLASQNKGEIVKHSKIKPLKSGKKQIVLNVFNKLIQEYAFDTGITVKLTAYYTGVA